MAALLAVLAISCILLMSSRPSFDTIIAGEPASHKCYVAAIHLISSTSLTFCLRASGRATCIHTGALRKCEGLTRHETTLTKRRWELKDKFSSLMADGQTLLWWFSTSPQKVSIRSSPSFHSCDQLRHSHFFFF